MAGLTLFLIKFSTGSRSRADAARLQLFEARLEILEATAAMDQVIDLPSLEAFYEATAIERGYRPTLRDKSIQVPAR